ncbi:MAG: peptidase S10 [Chloroflexi bacterium]|nr:MAG: peptidase S10 [Chloroflexota bacterium]
MSETNNNQNHEESFPTPEDKIVQTQHAVTIGGKQIPYTVTTGTIVLKEESEKEDKSEGEKAKASIFFVAYTKNNVADTSQRPLTFAFNGGPGSSSVWLHLGLLGPKRVHMDDTNILPPPYKLVENEYSLLDVTDLVFIDPVSTGFSRAVPGEKAKEFHGFTKDIESVGDFIRLYTTRYQRWHSPKFLAGESYGTTRSAGLSGYLQMRHGMYLNGIMLISSVLNFQTLLFSNGNDLPYPLFLPTYTATAWYHHKLDDDLQADLQATLAEVEAFALGEYASALMQGSDLPEEAQQAIAQKLARYTGLSAAYIRKTNLRINIFRFTKELLREEGLTVGRLDSRFTGIDKDTAGETFEFDPSYAAIQGPYTAVLNDYLRRELSFENDIPYEILTGLYQNWSYKDFENQFVEVAETLRQAMSINPHLKVLVANGYYDLATPYLATRYTFNHLGLDASLQDNYEMTYYEAGHMMYVHLPAMAQLKKDMARFVKTAVSLEHGK